MASHDHSSSHYKDLEDIAKTAEDDFYDLLGVTFESTHSEIKRQYRKTSIRYHPDKNPDNADAADLFIRLGHARDILMDEKLKKLYDTKRLARKQKALHDEQIFGERRRKMEDLRNREKAANDERMGRGPAFEREREIARLAEDTRRRKAELGAKRKREEEVVRARMRQRDQERESELSGAAPSPSGAAQPPAAGAPTLKEIDSTVKIRFSRDGEAATWDEQTLSTMFSKYGTIEGVVIGKDKKARASEDDKHRTVSTMAFIAFERLSSAHAAVLDAKNDFPLLESVTWVGKEPDLRTPRRGQYPLFAKSAKPQSTEVNKDTMEGITTESTTASSSFSPKKVDMWEMTMMRLKVAEKKRLQDLLKQEAAVKPPASEAPKPAGTDTPGLHDITMMRLKQAEKRRLEDEIRRQEAEEDAANAMEM